MVDFLEWTDLIYSLFLILLFYSFAKAKANKEIANKPYYKYYGFAVVYRLLFAALYCVIYLWYYDGGDTVNYFIGGLAIQKVLWNDVADFFYILNNEANGWAWANFEEVDSFPPVYMFRDPRTYLVMKMTSVIGILGFGGFMATTLFVSRFTFRWIWLIFELLSERYPKLTKELSWAFLFLPSVVFWGGAIMKDTFTFSATCGLIYYSHKIFVEKKLKLKYIIMIIILSFVILSIKSYIFFAFLPSLLIYLNFERFKQIKSFFLKLIIVPIAIGLSAFMVSFFIGDIIGTNGVFSSEELISKAVVQNQDLKRDVYGANQFDIGDFEPTIQGVLSKAPEAINAAFFRPYIWEVGSPTMFFSAIENTIILVLAIWLLLIKGVRSFFLNLMKDSFLMFCLVFCLFLGLIVGLSTPNFGALVRYRIPIMPFMIFMFLVLKTKTLAK